MPSLASTFIPPNNDTVIAVWPDQYRNQLINSTDTETLQSAIISSEGLLEQASLPGQSYLYSVAKTTLTPWLKSNPENAAFWLMWARVQQNKHDFDGAIQSLEKVIELDPNNANAHLIMARIHLILRAYELAQLSCEHLIRNGDLLTASVCRLEVQSHQGNLEQSYIALKKLNIAVAAEDPNKAWIRAILADMAARQGLWLESEALLDEYYNERDISALIEWADIKLKLKKYRVVDEKLSAVVKRIPSSEDALLLRLAIAEKGLNKQSLNSDLTAVWKARIAERVELREQRQDSYHASDLALFYLDIQPNAQRALHWAEINWRQAQEYKDKALLDRAKKAYGETKGRAL